MCPYMFAWAYAQSWLESKRLEKFLKYTYLQNLKIWKFQFQFIADTI